MSQERKTVLSDFTPICKLGEGSFSSVYKVKRNLDQNLYALKKVKIGDLKVKQRQNALNEVRILASINCEYIIGYKQAFLDQKFNLLCIIMQWASDLYERIKQKKQKRLKFTQNDIWIAAYHIASGLKQLHTNKILHRDLKSSNIFVSNGVYKLGDLNVSKVQSGSHKLAFTQTGTPYYASPQVWRDQPYDSKSDIWSYGCILYELCHLKPPFSGNNMQQLFKNIQKCEYDPIKQIYSSQLISLIQKCLKKNPRERPTCTQILEQFKQKFKNPILNSNQHQTCLLKTIKYEENHQKLQKNLPQPQYQSRPQSQSKRCQQLKAYSQPKNKSRQNSLNCILPTKQSQKKQECKPEKYISCRPNSSNQYRVKNCGKIYKAQLPPIKKEQAQQNNVRKIQSANYASRNQQTIHKNADNQYNIVNIKERYKPKLRNQLLKRIKSIKQVRGYQICRQNSNYNPIPFKPIINPLLNYKPVMRQKIDLQINRKNLFSSKSTREKVQMLRNLSANRSYERNVGKINYSNIFVVNPSKYHSNSSSHIQKQNIPPKIAHPILLNELPRIGSIINRIPIREQLVKNQKIMAEKYFQRITRNL